MARNSILKRKSSFLKFRFRLKNKNSSKNSPKNLCRKWLKTVKKYQEKITENNHKSPKNSSKIHQKNWQKTIPKNPKKIRQKIAKENCQTIAKKSPNKEFVEKLPKIVKKPQKISQKIFGNFNKKIFF